MKYITLRIKVNIASQRSMMEYNLSPSSLLHRICYIYITYLFLILLTAPANKIISSSKIGKNIKNIRHLVININVKE